MDIFHKMELREFKEIFIIYNQSLCHHNTIYTGGDLSHATSEFDST